MEKEAERCEIIFSSHIVENKQFDDRDHIINLYLHCFLETEIVTNLFTNFVLFNPQNICKICYYHFMANQLIYNKILIKQNINYKHWTKTQKLSIQCSLYDIVELLIRDVTHMSSEDKGRNFVTLLRPYHVPSIVYISWHLFLLTTFWDVLFSFFRLGI